MQNDTRNDDRQNDDTQNHEQHVALVVAMARNNVIGADGGMPWHLPEDLAHFKRTTMGTPMVMGRRTFESIGGPLPGRRSIVVTRNADWRAEGAEVAHSLEEGLHLAGPGRVSLIGGGELFAQAMEGQSACADELVVTYVRASVAGDTFFPAIDPQIWAPVDRREGEGCEYVTYRKRG